LPLYVKVLIGVVVGATVGVLFGKSEIVGGLTTADLGKLGTLVIRALKMLAIPLVLFAIVDAIARTEVTGRMGLRVIPICLFNVSVAFTIGLVLMNVFEPGESWHGHIDDITGTPGIASSAPSAAGASLSPLSNIEKWIPESFVQPFSENNVIGVVLLAILIGAAIRACMRDEAAAGSIAAIIALVEGAYHVVTRMLTWVIELVPFAVFGVIASVVGKAGLDVFTVLWQFLLIILVGMTIHAFVYYPLMAWVVGGIHPRVYLGRGANAIVTGLSTNSSLATVPITLKSLDAMGVSKESSRLGALVGTNLNNDGITLYEAMTALFLAQALGYHLPLDAQLTIVVASLMAGIGIAGIPEAGLIVLPLVLGAAGLPEHVVAALLPVVLTVDWILARYRTVVNVMSDMLVSILLDRWRRRDEARATSAGSAEQRRT